MNVCTCVPLFRFIEMDPLSFDSPNTRALPPRRVYVEEASYWGLLAVQGSRNEFEFVGIAALHKKRGFGG